jgi:hypothetical protein
MEKQIKIEESWKQKVTGDGETRAKTEAIAYLLQRKLSLI